MSMGLLAFARWARAAGKQDLVTPAAFAQFLEAIKLGDLERSHAMLRSNPDFLSRSDGAGATALHVAAAAGASDVVKLCLRFRADVAACDLRGETPLHAAARAGELVCLIALLDAGADPSVGFVSALEAAAEAEQGAACRLLLDHGACPEVRAPPKVLEELLAELYHVPKARCCSLSTSEGSSSEAEEL